MFSSSKYNLENVMNDKQQQSQGAVVSKSIAIGTIKHFGKLSRGTVMISGLSVSVELEESGGCSRWQQGWAWRVSHECCTHIKC